MLPLSSQSPPYCERQVCGGMKLVAHSLGSTCCLSHWAAPRHSFFFLTACCPNSRIKFSAQWQIADYKQLFPFRSAKLSGNECGSSLLPKTLGFSGLLDIMNLLPLASVADLTNKFWGVLSWPCSNSCPPKHDERGHLYFEKEQAVHPSGEACFCS